MATTASTTAEAYTTHIQHTEFWNTLLDDIYGARKGGAMLFVDAENARKGVAKTSAAVALARILARAFDYKISQDDFMLAGPKYIQRYRDQPGKEQPSVIVADELVGAGAGDSSRWMKEENRNLRQAAQILRAKRVVTIFTLPDWNDADPNLQKLADYRIWCREKPIGTFQPYKITTPFNAGTSRVGTKGLSRTTATARRIHFPNMPGHNDPYYRQLAEKKDELIDQDSWDADAEDEEEELEPEEIERRQAIRYAIRLYQPWNEESSRSYEDVAQVIEDYKAGWVGKRIREWRNGEHRDIVPDPRKS